MTTTKEMPRAKPAKKSSPGLDELTSVRRELNEARQELEQVHLFFEEVQKFSDLLHDSKTKLKSLLAHEAELKEELAECRADIADYKNLIDSSSNSMLAVIEPGPSEFMPLFDRMSKSDPKVHGQGATNWREKPISDLRLSPLAWNALVDADIIWIGQLQDMVLADPQQWWEETAGLTDAIAAAIVDKLNAFISKGGEA